MKLLLFCFSLLCPLIVSTAINVTRLDCGMRSLMLRYALKLQPWRNRDDVVFAHVHDALRLTDLCGIPPRATPQLFQDKDRSNAQTSRKLMPSILPPFCLSPERHCIFVSPGHSSPNVTSDGSIHHPVATAHEALALSRSIGDPSRTTIVFRGGVHELNSTLRLGPTDSGLSLQGFPGEKKVWISGGVLIPKNIGWKPWSKNTTVLVANLTTLLLNRDLPKVASVFTTCPHQRYIRARFPNSNPEIHQWGYATPGHLDYSIASDVVTEWQKPPPGEPPKFEFIDLADPTIGVPLKNDSTMPGYNAYASGSGGVCAELWGAEADSYWCSNASAGGWAEVDSECAIQGRLQIPMGMEYNRTHEVGRRLDGWGKRAVGGIVYAWHSQSWSMHMFEIESNKDPGTFLFRKGGGKQGGRNWCRCDQCTYAGGWCGQHQDPPNNDDKRLISGSWLVENVLAELDQPGEFFFDPSTRLLYLIPNVTTTEGAEVVPELHFSLLENIIELKNVSNVTISNIGLRDAAASFMSDWSAPSGGDWALHRGGAVFLENAEGIKVTDCIFSRLDGNAVFLSRRTRNVTIERSIFEWIGENAIATWGETDGYDATAGNQPRGTLVQDNIMRELGIYQKQSSAFGQAKAALSTIRNNIMFNMPRAAVNFNDMMGGGDVVERNLIFNTCRESGDHGPINSWDRQPFMTTLRDGKTRSFDPLLRDISRNFIFANYGASEAVDNDDGSSWFHIHDNVFYNAGGLKMDYGGHDSVFEDNLVMAFAYNRQQCVHLGSFNPGHGHVARGNKCIVGLGKGNVGSGCGDASCGNARLDSPESMEIVVTLGGCNDSHVGLVNNSYFTPNGTAVFMCGYDGSQGYSLEDMQNTFKLELGSNYGKTPSAATMIEWAIEILY